MIEIRKIENAKAYKKMTLCGTEEEKIYKLDMFYIDIDNIRICARAFIDNSYYFDISHIIDTEKNKMYKSSRYFTKYISIVRDTIFEYYEKKGLVKWLQK